MPEVAAQSILKTSDKPTGGRAAIATAFVILDWLLPWIASLLLVVLFWRPLFEGAGFIGGDTYNYFFPLKQFYAAGLKAGEIRLWHPGIGNGVPVLGESQTGLFYPFYLVLYRFLDLNTAYNAVFLIHYVLATVFAYCLARHLTLGRLAALLAATVFVYGWFPPRAALEWAIVTGAWLPLVVLLTLRWLLRGALRWGIALAGATCLQLLAGHFQLAFVTLLAVIMVALAAPIAQAPWRMRLQRRLAVAAFVIAGYGLAAPQLVPTWELKVRSQRQEEEFVGTVQFGHIPRWYFLQLITPFETYPQARDLIRRHGAATNHIEAHLYFGLVPFFFGSALIIALLYRAVLRGRLEHRWLPWLALVGAGFVLAEGSVFAWLSHLPGFGFFRYPGRYGLLAQLGFALLAAAAPQTLLPSRSRLGRGLTALTLMGALGVTLADLYWVSRQYWYVEMVTPPPIKFASASPVFAHLTPVDRVFAIDGNTLALSGAACVPPYIGMGPAEYYQIWKRMPNIFTGQTGPVPQAIAILQRMGVSHLLTEQPLPSGWPAEQVWAGFDPFLHRRWGRDPNEPLYLYRFTAALGRAYFAADDGRPNPTAMITVQELQPHRVVLTCRTTVAGRLVLTDLQYPGWQVAVDGNAALPLAERETLGMNLFRTVQLEPGSHQVVWHFVAGSLWLGGLIALITMALLGLSVAVWQSPQHAAIAA